MNKELQPCPFCGGLPVMETFQTLVSIRCDPCGVARGFKGPLSGARTEPLHTGSSQCRFTHPEQDYNHQAIVDAVDAWNSRALASAPKQAMSDEVIDTVFVDFTGMPPDRQERKAIHAIIAAQPVKAQLVAALEGVISAWDRMYPGMPRSDTYEDAEFGEFTKARSTLAAAKEQGA